MKKRIISMLLVLILVLGMVPVTAFAAAVELPVSEGSVDVTDAAVGPYTITTLSVYLQGSYDPVSILSATQDGTTINIVLGEDTDPSAALQAGFGGSGQGQLQHSGNKCTLSNGKGTMNYSFVVRTGPQAAGQGSYTIHFSMPMGEECQVTAPVGEGFTFTSGGAAYKDQTYTFQIAVNEGYDGTNLAVKVNDEVLEGSDGTYTVESVSGDLVITVEGIVKKEVCAVTLTEGEGYTVSSNDTPYKGEDYTFTVTPDTVYYKTAEMKVLLDGETELTGENGIYTISGLNGDCVITVVGIEKKTEYSVSKPEVDGVTVTGADSVLETDTYTFTVAVAEGYDVSAMEILVNGEAVGNTAGTYTVENVSSNLEITVTGVVKKNLCAVTLTEGEGYTISSDDIPYTGEDYTFTVMPDTVNYKTASMKVLLDGETELTGENGVYTIPALNADCVITVVGIEKKAVYTVTKPEVEGVTVTGADSVLETDPYTFTVTVEDTYYTLDMVVKVNGEAVELTGGSYTVASAAGDIVIAVEGVRPKAVYAVTKPEVEGVTVTGADTVLETETYTFSVAVAEGYSTDSMEVKVNGETVTGSNGSYSVENVSADLVITVEGISKLELCSVTAPTGKKFTFTGAESVYKGETYTFTVTPKLGYAAAVQVNGETVTGSNNQYTVAAVSEDLVITVVTARTPMPETELDVADNVIDITDKTIHSYMSRYYANAVNISVSGVTVQEAYEDGTTVYVILPTDTPDDAAVSVKVGTSVNNYTVSGDSGSLTLEEGEGSIVLNVQGKFSSSKKGTVSYTLIFFRNIPSETPPVRVVESDTAEGWKNRSLEIDLTGYFTDADSYYLVDGEELIPIEGDVYTYVPGVSGEQELSFKAGNEAGISAEAVTVTVNVKDVESGIYIGNVTGNGSLNFVQFYDADGNLIEGVKVTLEGKTIRAVLPKSYPVSGTVKAVFDLTQSGDVPFITTKTGTSGTTSGKAVNNKFTEKTTTLSAGAATFTFYYYNTTPTTNNNNYETWSIVYVLDNDLPVLAEGVEPNAAATVAAGVEYQLDLTPLFTDADNDTLTYQYKVGEGEWQDCGAAFAYTNTVAADYVLTFRAFDTKDYSTDTYTVTLTVENAKETDSMLVFMPEGLEPKFYVSTGYTDGVDQLGDAVEAVPGESADGMTHYTVNYPTNASLLCVRTEDWGGMAFATQKDGAVTLRQVKLSVVDYENNPAASTNTVTYDGNTAVAGAEGWLLLTGVKYTYTAVPTENTDILAQVTEEELLEAGEGIYTRELMLNIQNPLNITVPTGATAQLYRYKQYYSNEILDAKIIKDNGDGTTTFSFIADTKSGAASLIYRVTMPGKITKAGWMSWGQQNLTVTYTEDDKDATYRLEDYSGTGAANSGFTEDSVLLNINSRNNLSLSVGQTKTLKAYRVWEVIPVSYNNYIITPEFTYTILSGSDVVSLTEKASPSAGNGDWMTLTAVKEGIAVIEVTYGSMQVSGGQYDGIYGASDPARSGIVVVQVGGSNDTSVDFGIDCFSSGGKAGSNNVSYNPNNKKAWDAEFDTLYFTGSSGELQLTPSASGRITEVAVSHDKGASWSVLTGEDGTYTAPIVHGNNILRVKTASGTAYQVVRGDRISVSLKEVDGKSDGDGIVEAGETVRVALHGLHNPIPKMAGNYNPGYMSNTDGYSSQHLNYTANGKAIYGPGAQYNFITAANYVDVLMPEDGSSVTLTDGYIGLGVIGLTGFADGGDSHRNIPDAGCATRGSATSYHTRSVLPEITVEAGGESAPNTAPIVRADAVTEGSIYDDQKFAINPDTLFQDADGDALSFAVSVNGGEPESIGTDYKFIPEAVGIYELTFSATDGEESVQHTVTVTVTERPQEDDEDNTFDLDESEIAGYVTISFEDNGIRVEGETGLKFPVPLGTVVEPTKVPYKEGENIAQVTKRLLDSLGIGMKYSGTLESGFYLGAITDFEVDGTPYDSMSEFDAGVGSGWMITQNGTFINQGASEFTVQDGDILKWQYSCQLGADIGDDFYAGVNNTIQLIDEIGEVTLHSGEAIQAARDAYDKLTESEKQRVSNYQTLLDAEARFVELTKAAADEAAAQAVEEKIAAIGTVTLDSKEVIAAARTAYDALTDVQKELVDNYQTLLDAETAYAELVKTAEDEAAAKDVEDLIDAIGTVTLESEEKIKAAREAYGELTDVQKALVGNRDKLEAAEKELARLKDEAAAEAVEALIDAIGTVTEDSEEDILTAREAYNELTDEQKGLVGNLDVLEKAEEELELLKLAGTDITDIYKSTGDYLEALSAPVFGTINGEWRVLGLARAGRAVADSYYEAVAEYVKENIGEDGRLHTVKSTDNSRLIVALTAIGKDVTDVGGHDLLSGLNEMEYIGKQGVNGTIWALIAFDTHDYEIPAGDVTREKLVAEILSKQLSDGGWALSGTVSDPDMTGMALQALAPYYSSDSNVKKAVDKAVAALSGMQNADGTFTGSEGTTAESLAQVITALTTLEINPETDSRFVKNGVSALDALSVFYVEGGGFRHDLSGDRNMMATEQGYYALVSYYRLLQSKTSLYDMSDVDIQTAARDQAAAAAVAALIDAIGTVTLDSGDAIEAARDAYDALTDSQKALVENYKMLTDAEARYAELVKTAENEAAANAVEDLIDAIGTVTEDSEDKIRTARKAYDALTEEQQALVENYQTLLDAEVAYAQLVKTEEDEIAAKAVEKLIDAIGTVTLDSQEKIAEARAAYDALTDVQKALVSNREQLFAAEKALAELKNQAAAKAVEDLIEAIGKVTLKSGEKIQAARDAYDALTDSQKALVENYKTLTDAEEKYAALVKSAEDEAAANAVEELIDAIGKVTKDSGDKIKAARDAYDKLTEDQKALVENYKTLTDAEAKFKELNSTAKVTFTLLGCYKHDSDEVHTLSRGNLQTWISRKTYKVEPGATVKDVLELALKEAGMSCVNPTGNYVESINGIGEFSNGSNSGWMYTLNGTHPGLGVAEQTVKDGDVIVFHYTDDYSKEEGGTGFGKDTAIEKVENLINAIGTVTLDSKDKIDAARKAYDALTYTQKQDVSNYRKLTDAEAAYAKLKKADDEKKAKAVENLIDRIGWPVTLDSEDDIAAARKAYDALTADQKKLVGNYWVLTDAEYDLALLKADEKDKKAAKDVEDLIDAIGTVTLDSEEKIKAARDAYDKLTDTQKKLVKNYADLLKAEERLAALKALAGVENIYKTTGDYLENLGMPVPGSVGGEWMVIGLIRSGRQIQNADGYYEAVVKFVQENIDENGRLHRAKSTESARIILALTALGKDVTDVGGYDLLTGLNSMEYVQYQGINGPIWALLALDSGNYPAPEGDVTRESLIRVILEAQLADGGWALSGTVSDPDMTGMALQALAPYCESDADVKKAAEEAVSALSMMQAADGSFASIDGSSSESIAQVIAALSALGIDADEDPRFIKNGVSALDALCAFYVQGGGFSHIPDGKLDGMATEQSYYALAAYFRMLDAKTALFDMTDVVNQGGDVTHEDPVETKPAETEPAPTEPVADEDDGKGGFPWWLVIVIVVLAGAIVVLVITTKPKKGNYVR